MKTTGMIRGRKDRAGLLLMILTAALLLLCSCGPDTEDSSPLKADDLSGYDKYQVIEKYGGESYIEFDDNVLTEE